MTSDRIRPRRADVRRNLLRAAREEFLERGYARSGLRSISERAGYTKGAVYSNFASKHELLAEVLAEDFGEVSERFRTAAPSADEPWERAIGTIIDIGVAAATSDARMLRLGAEFALEAARDPELQPMYRTLQERRRAAVLAAVEPLAAAADGPSPAEVEAIYRSATSLITGWIIDHGALGEEPDPNALRAALTAQVRGGHRAPEPA